VVERKVTFSGMISSAGIGTPVTEKTGLSILKTLAYFDIFDYPLSEGEIRNFLQYPVSNSAIASAMKPLISDGVVFQFGEFYSLVNDWRRLEKRLQGNERAEKLLPKAHKIGAFLYKFPFVRGVGISGSLSKNYADANADIDFFIITKANRLWMARTLLHVFKKITFLLGRQHYYCMNYFIDEETLIISDENIYTATEMITLLPAAGSVCMDNFFETNDWVRQWFPAYTSPQRFDIADRSTWLKRITERLFNGSVGERLDNLFFRWTTRRWKRKESVGRRNSKGKLMNLVTGKHFSKSDPEGFQGRIVQLHKHRVEELRKRYQVD
jgi:hypothetical protein